MKTFEECQALINYSIESGVYHDIDHLFGTHSYQETDTHSVSFCVSGLSYGERGDLMDHIRANYPVDKFEFSRDHKAIFSTWYE